ncbi:tail fiber protein [Escherichia phage phAPEC8]|uniref:Tail fiber protein n=1 Tax=Escherichia phage phAPEC8 TaxID=1229753 RepID=K7QLS1_9CAUD|nr:tail protein [Escherichia phage phAPEC8]AFU62742.1 tail fiber protein [Escherichia phage phAPEC8]
MSTTITNLPETSKVNGSDYLVLDQPDKTVKSTVSNFLTDTGVVLATQLKDTSGATKYPELQMSRWRDEGDPRGWGAVGDGATDDTNAITQLLAAMPDGWIVDGRNLTFKVTTLPDISKFKNAAFVYERIVGQPLTYVSEGFFDGNLTKITDTPFYNAWTQDKTFVYDNVIYAPFMAGERHGVQNLHVAWVKSGDDGQTWSMPEWLTPIHPDYNASSANKVNYHCMSMGVCGNRLYAVIETRYLSNMRLKKAELWSRPMPYYRRPTGGITISSGSTTATIVLEKHGLKVGDAVNFSNSGATGVSGNMTVASVINKDTFTVTLASAATSNIDNTGTTWHFGTRFWDSPWEITELPDVAYSTNADLCVTETHSFTVIDDDNYTFAVGYHNGDVSPRRLGILYFNNAYSDPSSFTRRTISQEYADNAAEPCIKYYDGILYLTTRGTSTSAAGSTLAMSTDLGENWNYLRFPNNVHHTNLPFAKVGNYLYIFGTERSFGEWEGEELDNRYKGTYPRTFMCKINVSSWPTSLSDVQWFNITDQMYQGHIVNSACGVGSVCVKDGWLYYIFGGEDFLSPWSIGDNSKKLWYKHDGHPADLYSYRLKITEHDFVSRDFKYGATPNRTLPVSMGTDGVRHVSAPVTFDNDVQVYSLTVTGLEHDGTQQSAVRIKLDGDYGVVAKNVPIKNPSKQRLILCGGETPYVTDGSLLQLYGSNHTYPNRAVLYAPGGAYTQNNFMPYLDGQVALGGASNRWSEVYASTGTINTSDGTLKTKPTEIEDILLKAWEDIHVISYQWLSAVAEKGDSARIHFGVIAQDVRDILINYGLMDENSTDCKYAFLCYDEYPAMYDSVVTGQKEIPLFDDEGNVVIDEEGNPVTIVEDVVETIEIIPAGSRWGIRADQMFFIEMAYQRKKLKALEERLATLESK